MTRRSGKLDIARKTATALAALLVSGLLAAPALAHGDRYEGQHGRSAYRHMRGDVRGYGYGPAWRHRGFRTHVHGAACGFRGARHHRHAVHRAAAFRCAACRHDFHDRSAFYRHVHTRHGVPRAVIPGAVIQVGFGWVFHG